MIKIRNYKESPLHIRCLGNYQHISTRHSNNEKTHTKQVALTHSPLLNITHYKNLAISQFLKYQDSIG